MKVLERIRKAQTERREVLQRGDAWPSAREPLGKGDSPGHEFHGNQYTGGGGGGEDTKIREEGKGDPSLPRAVQTVSRWSDKDLRDGLSGKSGNFSDAERKAMSDEQAKRGGGLPQRSDYMAGKVTHEQYYRSVAREAGITYKDSDLMPKVKAALARGDEHLNSIPLKVWDMRAANPVTQANITRSLKAHGDSYSMAGGVSTLKQAAKEAAGKSDSGDLAKGEGPGHPFRGNQFTSGEGGGGAEQPKGQLKVRQTGSNQREVTHPSGTTVFYSYNTPVAAFIPGRGYVRTDEHYSVTTSKHINQWLGGANASKISQADMNSMAGGSLRSHGDNKTEVEMPGGRVFFSYQTPVAAVTPSGEKIRTSTNYSRTTSKHVTQFVGHEARSVPQHELDALSGKAEEIGLLAKAGLPQRPDDDEDDEFDDEFAKMVEAEFNKGEGPGHPFRGNQFTSGEAGGSPGATTSGKTIPSANDKRYTDRESRPKWNVKVSPRMDAREGGRMLRQRFPDYSAQDHEDAARAHMAASRAQNEKWGKTLDEAHQATFGKPRDFTDYKISGIGREEYSQGHKETARTAAHLASAHTSIADAHWRAAGHRNFYPRASSSPYAGATR